jgi:hypothetical protein
MSLGDGPHTRFAVVDLGTPYIIDALATLAKGTLVRISDLAGRVLGCGAGAPLVRVAVVA